MKLTLVVTHRCDLACAYCYAGTASSRNLPPAVGRRAVERALEGLAPGEGLDLGFFGGEPLLVWPLVTDLARFARRRAADRGRGLRLQLTTNGTRLRGRVLEEALELGFELTVSMDGLPEVHDAFRPTRGGRPSSSRALAAIDRLVARGADFAVNAVVRPETVARLPAGARFLADRGVRRLLPSLDWGARWDAAAGSALQVAVAGLRRLYVERAPDLEIGWIETKALLLVGTAQERPRCGVGEGEVAVAPSGRLYPCERLVGNDDRDLGYGHVDDPGPLRTARPCGANGTAASQDGCGDCSVRALCARDCACANLARTGDPARPDGLVCLLEQACLREAARALNEIAAGRRRLPVLEAVGG